MTRRLALVESPSQLLNTIEWAHAAGLINTAGSITTDQLQIIVLPPRDTVTRQQLGAIGALARAGGLRVDHADVRVASLDLALTLGRLVHGVRRTDQLVIGDPFSGVIQTVLPAAPSADIVVVDDGTATIEFAACVDAGRGLRRWRDDRPASQLAVRSTARLTPGPQRAVTVFTALPKATPWGALAVANEFAWTRQRLRPHVWPDSCDVVGTSLVESGIVREDVYLDAVATAVAGRRARRYFAHRRESAAKLANIVARTGLIIDRAALPVELTLRQGPVASTVITFPSTAAHTLPVVLADTPVRVELCAVDSSWFTSTSSAHARDFVHRIGRTPTLI